MVCMASSVGRSTRAKRSLRQEAMPSGIPMASEMMTATLISASVDRPSSQSSSMPVTQIPANPSTPATRPLAHQSPTPVATG